MKIMQLCFTKIINSAGGVEKVFCKMANYFAEQHEVINVICDGEKGDIFYKIDKKIKMYDLISKEIEVPFYVKIYSEAQRIFNKTLLNHPKFLAKNQFKYNYIKEKLENIIKKEAPNVIISYSPSLVILLKQVDFPLDRVVVMFHSTPILKEFSDMELTYLKKVKVIQVLTQEAKELMIKYGYNQTIVIGNALDNNEYNVLNYNKRKKKIICVARLDRKQKQQHILIEAFSKVSPKYPDWFLEFYGGNPQPSNYNDYLVKIIKKYNMQNKIKLMGMSRDVFSDIRDASICVLPSKYEGFCISLIEAMSLGIPCVGFKSCSAINELIKDGYNGYLANDGVNGLGNSLEKIIKDVNIRLEMSKNAIASTEEFKEEVIFEKWGKVIQIFSEG